MERFTQRSDVVSQTEEWCSQFYFFFQHEASSTVLNVTKAMDIQRAGRPERRELSSWSVTEWVRWPVSASSTELVAVSGGLTDEVPHGQRTVKESTEAFDPVREWDCGIVKLKGVGKNQGEFHLVLMSTASVFHYLHEVCFVSSSFWYQNNCQMWFSEEYGCFQVRRS